jgi:hypothetical protein
VPTFCRHNRLVQNCTICAREQNFEARPVVSSSAPKVSQPRERAAQTAEPGSAGAPKPTTRAAANNVRVRRLARGVEDGYRSQLLPGLKSSDDAARLAQELAFATRRLSLMEQVAAAEPAEHVPEVWQEIAAPGDIDERTLLAARYVLAGPRGLHAGDQLEQSLAGVEAWGARAGSLEAAFRGEPSWTPERRFERTFERLGGVHGLDRDPRYELLTTLGRLGVYELRPAKLFLRGENEATWAAKRVLGIGDPLLLNARAADLAQACQAPVEALDLAFHNWGAGKRVGGGLPEDAEGDELVLDRARSAFGV